MNQFTKNIWEENEYNYRAAYGFIPKIHAYIHDDDENRDCMLIAPGGGYCMCVPHEGVLPANEFYDKGMNVFVLTYTTDITTSIPLKKQPLNDIARAVRFIRKNASEYKTEGKKIIVCGFSAGAHVCGTLAVHFDDVEDSNPEYADISCRPDGAILAYPVITTGKYTHESSVWALIGQNAGEEEMNYFSLEKNVKSNTPPCFIWQTATDNLVPVENSYLFANALKEKDVMFAHYVFPEGFHGLSVPNKDFFTFNYEDYTMEQVKLAVAAVKRGEGIDVSDMRVEELKIQFADDKEDNPPEFPPNAESLYKDVRYWPDLAMEWMKRI